MLNNALVHDPLVLYRTATDDALAVLEAVRTDQLDWPTPCSEWTVQHLVEHLVDGVGYLLAASGGLPAAPGAEPGAAYRDGVRLVLAALAQPGSMDRLCVSPLGHEWTVAQAVAGTSMDVLIHTWDLARATGLDERLDPVLVQACTAMFLPDMPQLGRQAGIIGPEVAVGAGASAQDRLLAAMGRTP